MHHKDVGSSQKNDGIYFTKDSVKKSISNTHVHLSGHTIWNTELN